VSGDPLVVVADSDSVLARVMRILGGLPTEPAWVLVGGVAIFCRLGSITRPTQDADTVARNQATMMSALSSQGASATILSPGKIEIDLGGSVVKVDVMDLEGEVAADPEFRTAFRLAKKFALDTAERRRLVVSDSSDATLVDATIPLATAAGLVALKTVAIVGRPSGNSPHKIGSDIHDLVRLVEAFGANAIAAEIAPISDLAAWIERKIEHFFVDDIRLILTRLRNFDRSPGAQALDDETVKATAVLADALADLRAT